MIIHRLLWNPFSPSLALSSQSAQNECIFHSLVETYTTCSSKPLSCPKIELLAVLRYTLKMVLKILKLALPQLKPCMELHCFNYRNTPWTHRKDIELYNESLRTAWRATSTCEMKEYCYFSDIQNVKPLDTRLSKVKEFFNSIFKFQRLLQCDEIP